jgi:hypothetical protein
MTHHRPAARGQPNPRVSALEQRLSELVFKPTNASTDSRCVQAEDFSRSREGPGVSRHDEILQIDHVHGADGF